MTWEEQVEALARLVRSGVRLVIFAGAGISIPAGIPGGRGVVQRLKDRYPAALDPARDYAYIEAFHLALPGDAHREERRIFFEELCAGVPPAEEHDWVAQLVDAGVVRGVITTNFDHLTDFAMMARCRTRPLIFMFEDELDPALAAAVPTLTKLHGDFLFDDLANLPDEMQRRLDRNMHEKLRTCLRGAALLVLGYSGGDESVMGFLRELAGEPPEMTSVWWNIFLPSDRTAAVDEVVDAARAAGKTAEVIGPVAAVSVLRALGEQLGVAPPQPLPFGVNPAIANPRASFGHRFVTRRHRPPSRRRELTDAERELADALRTAAAAQPWTWVVEAAPLEEMVAELAAGASLVFDTRRAFVPRDRALLEQFETHAALHGVPGANTIDATELLTAVFRTGVLAIVLHPFRSPSDLMEDMLARLLVARERAGSGHVLVIDQEDPGAWMDALRERAAHIDPYVDVPPPYTVRGTTGMPAFPDDAPVSFLAALRFAPSIDLAAALLRPIKLEELEHAGAVRIEHDRVFLAERLRRAWRGRIAAADHCAVAEALERAAEVEAQNVRASFLVEAEHHWFEAGEYERALRLLLTFGIADTAARYFCTRVIAWAPILIDSLPRVHLDAPSAVSLVYFCESAIRAYPPVPGAGEAASAVVDALRARIPPVWDDLLTSEVADGLPVEERYALRRRAYLQAKASGDETAYVRALRGMSSFWLDELTRSSGRRGYRRAERALLFSRAVRQRALEAGDHDLARLYRDNELVALGTLGRIDEQRQAALAQLRALARNEGLSYEKGVVYGNVFVAELAAGEWKRASGLLPESQLNFWYGNHVEGIVMNLRALWGTALDRPDAAELPRPRDVCAVVVRTVSIGSCDDARTMALVSPILEWSVDEACIAGDMRAACDALAGWIRVRDANPGHASTDAAFLHFYQWIGAAYFTFGDAILEPLRDILSDERRHLRSHMLYVDLLGDETKNVELLAMLYCQDSDRGPIMRAARRDAEAYVRDRRR